MVKAEVASRAYIQSVDSISIELLDAAESPLASQTWRNTFVGRDLGPSSLSSTKYLTLEHSLSEAELTALFTSDAKPKVRVTISEVD